LIVLGHRLQPLEPIAPELVQERAHLHKALGACPVEAARSVTPFRQQPGLLEDGQMLGDCRAGDVEVRGDLAGAALVLDEAEDLTPARLGQGFQCGFDAAS
jgi:hypothetical protein